MKSLATIIYLFILKMVNVMRIGLQPNLIEFLQKYIYINKNNKIFIIFRIHRYHYLNKK